MEPIVLNGKELANQICADLAQRFKEIPNPCLTIFTSNDPASQVYVKNKVKRGEELGVTVYTVPVSSCQEIVDYLTSESMTVTPFIVQLPNPDLDENELDELLSKWKEYDVDGFSTANIGLIANGNSPFYYPCTPLGVVTLLEQYNCSLEGEHVLIIGRSNIVGKPLSYLMTTCNATVTLAHSKTSSAQLTELVKSADIIVSATGHRDMLKDIPFECFNDKILIDIGINRNDEGKICGDFYPPILEHCLAYTPVPNGIGPMTVAMLFRNVLNFWQAYYAQTDIIQDAEFEDVAEENTEN